MDGLTLKSIRERFGCPVADFGRALGIQGESLNVKTRVRQFEKGERELPRTMEIIARLYLERGGIPDWVWHIDDEELVYSGPAESQRRRP